jgi:hypothetical protein
MKRILACLFLILAAPPTWAGDAPPTVESLRGLLEMTGSRKMLDTFKTQMESSMRAGMRQGLGGAQLNPEQQKIVDDMQVRLTAVLMETMDWGYLEPMMIDVYTKNFTQREVDGMVAFYRSEAGAALISKMPVVMQEIMQSAQARAATMLPKIQQIQREAFEELKAAGDKSPAPR